MARNPLIAVTEIEEVMVGGGGPTAAGRATDWGAGRDRAPFVFLAAPSCSSYITGEVLPVIGGYSGG
jgi:hypothetical protein